MGQPGQLPADSEEDSSNHWLGGHEVLYTQFGLGGPPPESTCVLEDPNYQ